MPRRLDTFFASPPPPPSLALLQVRSSGGPSKGSDLNPSLLIIGGIVLLVLVVSTSLHLLLRYLNRRCIASGNGDEDVEPIEPVHVHRLSGSRVVPEDHQTLIDSLPLFSFDSVSGLRRSSSADCAVCLSKFEPHDQLRLLPICCHAFHSRCIDTWLVSNYTCPLCRSTILLGESDGYLKLFSSSSGSGSFRLEIGSVSRRRIPSDSGDEQRRSYSMGSFDYLVDDESEIVVVEPTHRRGASECSFGGKKNELSSPTTDALPNPPGSDVAAEVAGGRGWLRDYVDRIASSSSSSFSSRALSFRLSGRFFTGSNRCTEGFSGSSRRGDGCSASAGGGSWDFDRNGLGEEIGNVFRWLSGV